MEELIWPQNAWCECWRPCPILAVLVPRDSFRYMTWPSCLGLRGPAYDISVSGASCRDECFWRKSFMQSPYWSGLWDSEKSEWTPTSIQHFWTNVQYVQFSAARQQRWLSIPRILKKAMQQRLEFMQIQWTFCVALLRVKETGKKIIPRPVGCPVAVCPPSHVRSSIVMGAKASILRIPQQLISRQQGAGSTQFNQCKWRSVFFLSGWNGTKDELLMIIDADISILLM